MKKYMHMTTLLITLFTFTACQSIYYSFWEKLGKEKRHLLQDNIETANEEQQEATEEFKDILTRIKEMYQFDGGKLESAYSDLKADYEDAEARAAGVKDRIEKVETIASDLFEEWQGEIDQISRTSLQAKSSEALIKTKRHYTQMHLAMLEAEKSIPPVLQQVKDYVLFLKHNLNANAVSSLEGEMKQIEVEIDALIVDLNKSVQKAQEFIKEIED